MPLATKDDFDFDYTTQPDYPTWTPSETKENMNKRGEELRVALNEAVNEANSTLETKENITNNRKLSVSGNFTGTWNGVEMTESDPGLASEFELYKSKNVSIISFGAIGDGVTDDTFAVQSAIDYVGTRGGGNVYFPNGHYKISRNIGTYDRWGLALKYSNVRLVAQSGAIFSRFNSIVTDSNAYPIVFIGVPDSLTNVDQIMSVSVDGFTFIGDDVRHTTNGSVATDWRDSIHIKNAKDIIISNNTFTKIDSSAILVQQMGRFGTNPLYFGKAYNLSIRNNKFYGMPHSTIGRALLHAIALNSCDGANVESNYSEWCDDFVAGETTYWEPTQDEDDTYVYNGATYRRSGRDWIIANNNIYDSSEHAIYMAGVNCVISGNNIVSRNKTVCISDIKIRGRSIKVKDNTIISGCKRGCLSIVELAIDVTLSDNELYPDDLSFISGTVGAVVISSQGIKSWVDARRDFIGDIGYPIMKNIIIKGNTIVHITGDETYGIAFYISSDLTTTDLTTTYPFGQLDNIIISDNIVENSKVFLAVVNKYTTGEILVSNNNIKGKPFDKATFSASTALLSKSLFACNSSAAGSANYRMSFVGNQVTGFENLLSWVLTEPGVGAGYAPSMEMNRFNYVQKRSAIHTSTGNVYRPPTSMFYDRFMGNYGYFFLDRSVTVPTNSLHDGVNVNSLYKSCFRVIGTELRFYTDDIGTSTVIN